MFCLFPRAHYIVLITFLLFMISGLSNGGIMAYRLACDLSHKVAAIAPVAAAPMLEDCRPTRPISLMIFHGTRDKSVPIEGGLNPKAGPRRAFPPMADTIRSWVKRNQCSSTGRLTYQKGEVTCTSHGPCSAGTDLVYCQVEGGGHTWPGGTAILERRLGHTTTDISASEAMWDFFERHPLPNLASAER